MTYGEIISRNLETTIDKISTPPRKTQDEIETNIKTLSQQDIGINLTFWPTFLRASVNESNVTSLKLSNGFFVTFERLILSRDSIKVFQLKENFKFLSVIVIFISDGVELERFTASKDDFIRQKINDHFSADWNYYFLNLHAVIIT